MALIYSYICEAEDRMLTPPGWNSIQSTSVYARAFTYAGWAALFLLGIFEILAHTYGNRKDVLVAAQEEALKRSNESQINSLKFQIGQQDQTIQGAMSSSKALRAETENNLKTLASEREALSSSTRSIEQQRKAVEELAKRTERHDRILTEEQAQELFKKMRVFRGQKYWIITETSDYDRSSEQMRFSDQLLGILTAAGWTKYQYPTTNSKMPLPLYQGVTMRGIRIAFQANSQDQLRIAQEFSAELTAANVDSTLIANPDLSEALLITIGLR
jgi:hypothetical protein